MALPIPNTIRNFFSQFPLYTYPAIQRSEQQQHKEVPTLWILPPDDPNTSVLSSDVECLKWQAYIALQPRNVAEDTRRDVKLRWDVDPAGGIDGALPTLCIRRHNAKSGHSEWAFLGPKGIAEWIDGPMDLREIDQAHKDEMEAWIQLLEGDVHDALIVLNDTQATLGRIYSYLLPGHAHTHGAAKSRTALIPMNGLGAMISFPLTTAPGSAPQRPFDIRRVREQFSEAIRALSVRLGGDEWFLGSRHPTALDALAFAYLCKALSETEQQTDASKWIRREVWKYVNLVRWESKVKKMVEAAYR